MGSQEVLKSSANMDAKMSSCNGGLLEYSYNFEENENLGVDLLNDLDSYWEDITGGLTVSRMVSDSVIKGMVCAIQQEAAEKIAQKELELAGLKEMFHLNLVAADSDESLRHSPMCHEFRKFGFLTDSNSLVEHDNPTDSLSNLKFEANKQFKKLKKEIDKIKLSEEIGKNKCSDSSRRKGSGLSDILQDKWNDVDRMLDGFRNTLESIYMQAEYTIYLSKSLLFDWLQEREFQAEIEGMVIKNCIQSLQEEFEQRLWYQNAQSFGNDRLEQIKEISVLRQELDAITKSLSVPESEKIISHGSLEHRKVSGNHASSPSLWESNGKHDESLIVVSENLEHAKLSNMSNDELCSHLQAEMTKMKRQYESKEHEMTEEYYTLKREYLKLKERPSLPVVKDKELEMLKKKIPDIILKLDGILLENEKLHSYNNNGDCFDTLKDRLDSLHSENRQLRDLLMDKKKEIKCLSSQVSEAAEKILKHSMAEENLSRRLKDLKFVMEDAQIEASIHEDIHEFILKQVVDQMKGFRQELDMEYDIMQGIYEVIFEEAAHNAVPTGMFKIEDSIMESIVMQSICEVIFKESFKEAEEKVCTLNMNYISEKEVRVSLETQALEKENALRLNMTEKEKLEQEVLLLKAMIYEKANLVQEAEVALAKEKDKFELASQELGKLSEQTTQQELLISRYNEESLVVKRDLDKLLKTTEMDKEEISELRGQLETVTKKLVEADEEKSMVLSISQEHKKTLSLVEAREREHRKQMNSTIALVQGLSKAVTDFECRATKEIKMNSLRLENLISELSSLLQKASRLRRTGLLYKHKLERRCSDLQKAESEVDLLGDEVDTLLSLIEKIYIALDHYSPILQHYAGIMDILKLVRRELNGQSVEPV